MFSAHPMQQQVQGWSGTIRNQNRRKLTHSDDTSGAFWTVETFRTFLSHFFLIPAQTQMQCFLVFCEFSTSMDLPGSLTLSQLRSPSLKGLLRRHFLPLRILAPHLKIQHHLPHWKFLNSFPRPFTRLMTAADTKQIPPDDTRRADSLPVTAACDWGRSCFPGSLT